MRELKFRAWDKTLQEWTDAFDIDNHGTVYPAMTKTNSKIEIMQFTGLYDKNGKEIYEGDIVQPYLQDYKADPQVIKYLGHGFTMCDLDTTDSVDGIWYLEVEIIGNIYEN